MVCPGAPRTQTVHSGEVVEGMSEELFIWVGFGLGIQRQTEMISGLLAKRTSGVACVASPWRKMAFQPPRRA